MVSVPILIIYVDSLKGIAYSLKGIAYSITIIKSTYTLMYKLLRETHLSCPSEGLSTLLTHYKYKTTVTANPSHNINLPA